MPSDFDEVWDQEGNLVSSTERVLSAEETARRQAPDNLVQISDTALQGTPWGPMIADILRVLGYK